MPRQKVSSPDTQLPWLERQLRVVKQDLDTIRQLCPDLMLPELWGHSGDDISSPETLLQHIHNVIKDSHSPTSYLHAALHLGELNQALKIAAVAEKNSIAGMNEEATA